LSDDLQTQAEVFKLARLLEVEAKELEYLQRFAPETLAKFRRQLIDSFYGQQGGNLERFAKIGNLLPSSAIAALTKEAVGPVLAARIAGFLNPKQAAAVVEKLPIPFVADIAAQIDPRRVEPVVVEMSAQVVKDLSLELIAREEYVTMGQFVGFVSELLLHDTFAYTSDAALLQIAFVAEGKERLALALGTQSDARIKSLVKTAANTGLWNQALDLLSHLDDEQYGRVVNIASQLDAKTLDQVVASTNTPALWQILIPALGQMEDPSGPVAALLRADAGSIKSFAQTVSDEEAWDEMRALLGKCDKPMLTAFRERLSRGRLFGVFKPVETSFAV
jgi:hypothetical protein